MITFKKAIKLTMMMTKVSGETVKIVHPTLNYITDAQFKQIQKATKEANGNDITSYKIEYKNVSGMSKAEMMRAGNDNTVENMSRMGE